MNINVMLKYTIHVKYIYKKNIDFYRNQMNQNVLHNKMLTCMANFIVLLIINRRVLIIVNIK